MTDLRARITEALFNRLADYDIGDLGMAESLADTLLSGPVGGALAAVEAVLIAENQRLARDLERARAQRDHQTAIASYYKYPHK